MVQEELESEEENDPLEELGQSFQELGLTEKTPTLMDRLATKMIEITEAEKLLESKRNNPFSKANREAYQQRAP
jgi:hypothetical protein